MKKGPGWGPGAAGRSSSDPGRPSRGWSSARPGGSGGSSSTGSRGPRPPRRLNRAQAASDPDRRRHMYRPGEKPNEQEMGHDRANTTGRCIMSHV